jgi:hypothetical protein
MIKIHSMYKISFSLLGLLVMAASSLQAQVTHEQTYDRYTQVVTYPGELVPKYFQLVADKQQAKFYKADHSLFKTIDIPTVPGVLQHFNYLSAKTFDTDGGKEYLVTYRDTATGENYVRIYDDDKTIMLDTLGHYGLIKSMGEDQQVLMVYNYTHDTTTTKVYSLGGNETPVDYQRSTFRFDVYPNPTTDYFRVALESIPVQRSVHYKLFNVSGKLVREERVPHNQNNFRINVQSLSPGVYLLRLDHPDGRTNTKRVIVTN